MSAPTAARRRAGILTVTNDLLEQRLFPGSGLRVCSARPSGRWDAATELLVEGHELPEVPEGAEPLHVTVTVTQTADAYVFTLGREV